MDGGSVENAGAFFDRGLKLQQSQNDATSKRSLFPRVRKVRSSFNLFHVIANASAMTLHKHCARCVV